MPRNPPSYSPSKQEANRARQQGAGMGQRDLEAQEDPGAPAGEPKSFSPEPDEPPRGERAQAAEPEALDAGPDPEWRGTPANVDPHDFEDGDSPQLDWGESEPGAIHGQTHTRRPVKTEASRGQGRKTRARNKQIVSGKPFD